MSASKVKRATAAIPTAGGYAVGGTTSGSRRAILRRFLHSYAHGRCVVCGLDTDVTAPKNAPESAEGGHIVPGGKDREGYYPGNLGNMCRVCNEDAGNRDLRPMLDTFAYPAGIPLAWPTWADLEARFGQDTDARAAEIARRRAARKSAGARW